MTKALSITYSTLHRHRDRLFAIIVGAIVITLGTYVFLVQKAIVNVVERERVVAKVNEKSTAVGELEAKYFTIKNSVTLEMAHSKGFKDTNVSAYISKKSVTAMASHDEL